MSAARLFYVFDHPLAPTPYNHRFFVEKFARGFRYHGYEMRRVTSVGEVEGPGFVLISNHDVRHAPSRAMSLRAATLVQAAAARAGRSERVTSVARAARRRLLSRLVRRCRDRGITMLGWFCHEEEPFFTALEAPLVYTGEYFYADPRSEWHRRWRAFYLERQDALPIRFSADVDPEHVGEGSENTAIEVAFVGAASYKPDWYRPLAGRPRNRIVPTPPYIDEEERLRIYRDSKIVLGLHSDDNIANAVVVERVFEALAYGAICITDNPHAVDATNGVARHVEDSAELQAEVDRLLADEAARLELRARGFDAIRGNGSYAHRAREFIELAHGYRPSFAPAATRMRP